MAELDQITETLRRQREDLETLLDQTASRSGDTAKILEKIGDLRARCEKTQRLFEKSMAEQNERQK
jgi:hypothetical protein